MFPRKHHNTILKTNVNATLRINDIPQYSTQQAGHSKRTPYPYPIHISDRTFRNPGNAVYGVVLGPRITRLVPVTVVFIEGDNFIHSVPPINGPDEHQDSICIDARRDARGSPHRAVNCLSCNRNPIHIRTSRHHPFPIRLAGSGPLSIRNTDLGS